MLYFAFNYSTAMAKKFIEIKWVQEVLVLAASFILITLNGWQNINSFNAALQALVYFSILYIHAIAHRFIILPLFFRKKYVIYIFSGIALAMVFSGMLYFTSLDWLNKWIDLLKVSKPVVYIYLFCTCLLSLVAILGTFILIQLYDEGKKRSALQIEINEMELKLLHSQLNPNFLRNTFNRLHSISLTEPSHVPELMLEISKIMRYHIESYTRELVALEDELAFIESYIAFEEDRVAGYCSVEYNYSNFYRKENCMLTPLILIPFIENAFKHGAVAASGKSFIKINIQIQDKVLNLEVTNSMQSIKNTYSRPTSLEIKGIERRLHGLYSDNYKLTTEQDAMQYKILLQLPLIVL